MAPMTADKTWPTEIRLLADKTVLAVAFDDGCRYELTAEILRVRSPSAEVQGHTPEQRVIVAGKHDVRITGVEPVGSYAVRLVFDDGHRTGLYAWDYLRDCGEHQAEYLAAHLAELEAHGLSR
jgi:DUF971 family protein